MQGKLDGKSCPVLPCPIGCFRRIGQCLGRRKSQVSEKIFRSIKQIKVPDFLRNQELFGGDYWTRTSDLLRVKEFAETGIKSLCRSWLQVLIFRILQHFLQMVARIRRNLPDEATVYDMTAL